MQTIDFKAFYINDAGDSVEGIFKMRRLPNKVTTDLLPLSRKTIMKDGKETVVDDNAMAGRVWLASCIVECPATLGIPPVPWAQSTDILAKQLWIGERLEEDFYAYLLAGAKSMRRMTKETENLYQASSQ